MDCEKCGAEVTEGAETCSECGEPIVEAPAAEEAAADTSEETADFFAEDAAPQPDAKSDAPATIDAPPAPDAPSAGGSKKLMWVVVGVIVLALAGAGVWFAMNRVAVGSSPEAVAKQMLEAYAVYDAQGILAVSTHDTMQDADIKQFEKQAADAKKTAKDLPSLKNITIGKSSETGTSSVSVDVTAEWLDPTTGKYSKRTEKLILVKKDGKWLVELF